MSPPSDCVSHRYRWVPLTTAMLLDGRLAGRRGSSRGSAYVYSGKDGTLLWQLDGAESLDDLGKSVAGVGDINRDGFDDVIVGAPRVSDSSSRRGAAFVYVYMPAVIAYGTGLAGSRD